MKAAKLYFTRRNPGKTPLWEAVADQARVGGSPILGDACVTPLVNDKRTLSFAAFLNKLRVLARSVQTARWLVCKRFPATHRETALGDIVHGQEWPRGKANICEPAREPIPIVHWPDAGVVGAIVIE